MIEIMCPHRGSSIDNSEYSVVYIVGWMGVFKFKFLGNGCSTASRLRVK